MVNDLGDVNNSYTYSPFGEDLATECTETTENPYKFTGQYFDSEIGQYYLRVRMYDPALMRFTGRDPVKGENQQPMTLHPYLYCLNNSLNRVDPSGLTSLPEEGTVIGTGASMSGAGYNSLSVLDKVRGFTNYVNFRNVTLAKAAESGGKNIFEYAKMMNYQIHHIVSRGWGNMSNIGNNFINSLENLIPLDKGMHGQITQFFNRGSNYYDFLKNTNYSTLGEFVAKSKLTYEQQMEWGASTLDYLIGNGTMEGFVFNGLPGYPLP